MSKPKELNLEALTQWRASLGFDLRTSITPEVLGEIAHDMSENGLPLATACRAAGVTRNTWNNWTKAYPQLADLMDQARAQWERKTFLKLQAAYDDNPKYWTSLAWSLERTNPDDWAQRGPDQGNQPKLVVQIGKAEHVDIKALLADGTQSTAVDVGPPDPIIDAAPIPEPLPSGDGVRIGPEPPKSLPPDTTKGEPSE